jgi:hypothetical protein
MMNVSRLNKRTVYIAAIVALTALATGCKSTPKANCTMVTRKVTITTEPPGATVYQIRIPDRATTKLGTSPVTDTPVMVITSFKMENMPPDKAEDIMRAAGGNLFVRIQKEGYQTYEGILSTKAGQTAAHNIKLQPEQQGG